MQHLHFKAFIYLALFLLFFPYFSNSQTNHICGVTLDNVDNSTSSGTMTNIKNSLSGLPRKPTVRVVFYPSDASPLTPNPTQFDQAVTSLKTVSYVMGQILDSWYWDPNNQVGFNHDNVLARSQAFMNNTTLASKVDFWEIGNEVNGEWLFNNNYSEVQRTVYDVAVYAKSINKRTALTLFYNTINCTTDSNHLMMNWVNKLIQTYPQITSKIDYLLISYYYDPCEGSTTPNWQSIFTTLHSKFPNALLGMGECGWTADNNGQNKINTISNFYSMNFAPALPYVVGNFYWTYQEDCVNNYATNQYWLAIKNKVILWPPDTTTTGIGYNNTIPDKFEVESYPNPFNPTTNIKYAIPKDGIISVKVFDITGKLISEIYNGYRVAGTYIESFDGTRLASGIYFLRVENQGSILVRKLSLIK